MNTQPLVVKFVYPVESSLAWDALTDKEKMRKWYFDMDDFKAVPGFAFRFSAKTEKDIIYVHHCVVTEVIPGKKLAYSWRYEGYPGNSHQSFELSEESGGVGLKLTHSGLESFADNGPDFAVSSFQEGWNYILGKSLPDFLETNSVAV